MPSDKEQQWIAAWRRAAPELERIRNQELRQLDDTAGMRLLGAMEKRPTRINGLVAFQAWMMRARVIQLTRQLSGS